MKTCNLLRLNFKLFGLKGKFLIILFFLSTSSFSQIACRSINSPSTINTCNYRDSLNRDISTYITFKKNADCSNWLIYLFSLKEDTLDGMLYVFLPTGEICEWFEIKNGLIWNVYVNNDSLVSYNINNGNGYMDINYIRVQNQIILTTWPTERIYYNNGYPVKVENFNKDGTFFSYYNIHEKKNYFTTYTFEKSCYPSFENMDSSITDSLIFYSSSYTSSYDNDTLFAIGDDYIVIGYKTNSESHSLLPYDYYIPSCYSNKKRERYLKKLKRYLIPIYEKHGKFTDEYSILFYRYTKKHIKQLHIQRDVTP
jgi:hypothetical protein